MLDEEGQTKDFLLRRIILNLESNKVLNSIKVAVAHAESNNDLVNATLFRSWIDDNTLIRKIAKIDNIKSNPEIAFEYYDSDTEDDPYQYDQVLEDQIEEIEINLWRYIGEMVKEEGGQLNKILESLK